MSVMDQAFFKAYGSKPRVAEPVYQEAHEESPAAEWIYIDGASERVPRPHAHFAAAAERQNRRLDQHAAVSQPAAGELRPMYEVPSFVWPAIVSQLLDAMHDELLGVAQELVRTLPPGRRLVLVSSPNRAEGRTTLLLSLARAAAERHRVAIVDADCGRPHLAETLGLSPLVGWEDVLAGRQPLNESLIESISDQITLLPWKSSGTGLRETPPSARMADSLTAVAAHFDLVLVDGGPWHSGVPLDELPLLDLGHAFPSALVVRDLRRTTSSEVEDLGERLAAAGIRRWDIVECFAPTSSLS